MTVESLRHYFSSLTDFVRNVGGPSPAADELQKVGDALKPFNNFTLENLGELLAHADDYHRTGKIAVDAPVTTVADLNAHIQQIDVKLRAAKRRLPEMKRLDKERTAAQKRTEAAAKKAATKGPKSTQPDEVSQRIADAMNALTQQAQTTEVSDDVIDAEIAKLEALSPAQLRHVALLIKADAGLTSRSTGKAVIARITERLRRVKDTYDRADL